MKSLNLFKVFHLFNLVFIFSLDMLKPQNIAIYGVLTCFDRILHKHYIPMNGPSVFLTMVAKRPAAGQNEAEQVTNRSLVFK